MTARSAILSFMVTFFAVGIGLLVPSSQAQQSPGDATGSSRASGRISGRVVNVSGDPLTNAVVYVATLGVTAPPRSAIVGNDGTFKMEGLEVGAYSVWANAPGFVSDAPTPGLPSRGYYHTGDSVNLRLTKGGVITGTVTNSSNAPVVAATVRAFRVRDENGKPIDGLIQVRDRMSDDRGFYRIYGLQPGTYVVCAGGSPRPYGGFGATLYDNDAPTYAPSSTPDTAMEVPVQSGEEVTVDVQYRGESGHSISGTVLGVLQTQTAFSYGSTISITDLRTRTVLTNTSASSFNNYGFAFYGLADGEYELVAQQYSQSADTRMSEPRRMKIQGADITGINLTVAPLPSISGHLVLESNPPADCVKRRATAPLETVISARRWNQPTRRAAKGAAPATTDEAPLMYTSQTPSSAPDTKGDFLLRNLHSGSYRVNVQLPSSGWYLRSMTLGSNLRTADGSLSGEGIAIKNQSVSGLTITISEGAASVRGHVSAAEGQSVPAGLRIYLVPAEKESAKDALRYFESPVDGEGNFAFGNLAPGHYWIAARVNDESNAIEVRSLRDDATLRSTVLHDAEASRKEIMLQRCQRIIDYELPFMSANGIKP